MVCVLIDYFIGIWAVFVLPSHARQLEFSAVRAAVAKDTAAKRDALLLMCPSYKGTLLYFFTSEICEQNGIDDLTFSLVTGSCAILEKLLIRKSSSEMLYLVPMKL